MDKPTILAAFAPFPCIISWWLVLIHRCIIIRLQHSGKYIKRLHAYGIGGYRNTATFRDERARAPCWKLKVSKIPMDKPTGCPHGHISFCNTQSTAAVQAKFRQTSAASSHIIYSKWVRIINKREKQKKKAIRRHKKAPVADGPFTVTQGNGQTVVIERTDSFREEVSIDRVEPAPSLQGVLLVRRKCKRVLPRKEILGRPKTAQILRIWANRTAWSGFRWCIRATTISS